MREIFRVYKPKNAKFFIITFTESSKYRHFAAGIRVANYVSDNLVKFSRAKIKRFWRKRKWLQKFTRLFGFWVF